MSGNVWMFSDEIDDEDLEFMSHDYVTYNMACEYYRLRQWFQKLRMNGQRKMRRNQRKLLHLLIVKHGGSAGIAIMNGIHLFLHAQAEASVLVAVAIPL